MEPNHSNSQQQSNSILEQREQRGGNSHMPLWIALGVSLSLLLAVVAFIVGTQLALEQTNDSESQNESEQVDETDESSEVDEMTSEEGETDKGETVVVESSSSLTIDWVPVAEQRNYIAADWVVNLFDYGGSNRSVSEFNEYYETILLGEVQTGSYEGYQLFQQNFSIGMGSDSYFYYLKDTTGVSKPVILDRYGIGIRGSNTVRELLGEYYLERLGDYAVFDTVLVPELEPLTSLRSTTNKSYEFIGFESRASESEIGNISLQIGSTQDGYRIYESDTGDIYLIREDGMKLTYALDIPFWQDESVMVSRPGISWNDRSSVGEYSKGSIGGCGFTSPTRVIQESDRAKLGQLVEAGTASGETIYVPADLTLPYFETLYDNWDRTIGGSLADFEDQKPVFYWEDQMDRLLEFQLVDILPAAECGKPVIYLYPEETMDVRVEVEPKGGFTFTEPAYNGGWEVTASPDGTLVNKADGEEYPYLFWEGRGGLYEAPNNYWVVKRSKVKRFLQDTLAEYGLNKQEIADFNEFWVPRMKEAKYYRIGFHTTAVMDEIAPLNVSGDPQTIFRILMDFDELDAWEEEHPPRRVEPFKRNGFTVVEWGGVIE